MQISTNTTETTSVRESWYKKIDWRTAFAGGVLGTISGALVFNLFQRTVVRDELITALAKYSEDDPELKQAVKNRICELRAEAGQLA